MSVYSDGVGAIGGGYRRRAVYGDLGAAVVMPAAIQAEIQTVESGFAVLNRAIRAAQSRGQVTADFAAGWTLFYGDWQNFRSAHGRWVDNLWYASYEKTLEYRQRLDDWRKKFEEVTGKPLGFPTAGAAAGPRDDKPMPWRTLLIIAAVGGGLYAVSKTLTAAAELKREFAPAHHVEHEAIA